MASHSDVNPMKSQVTRNIIIQDQPTASPQEVHIEHGSRSECGEAVDKHSDEDPTDSGSLCSHIIPIHLREVS